MKTWRKSSFSGAQNDCVRVRSDLSALGDTKAPAAVLPVPRAALTALTTFVR